MRYYLTALCAHLLFIMQSLILLTDWLYNGIQIVLLVGIYGKLDAIYKELKK